MTREIITIFKENFPFIVREEETVNSVLENKDNRIFEKRNEKNELIGVCVVNKNTILLLCVKKEYRNKGVGTLLLKQSEGFIKQHGYNEVNVGVGFNYLMPGVPTNKKVYKEKLEKDNIYKNVDDVAYKFFKNRGYYHSWNDANCFDMRLDLKDFNQDKYSIGDTINGISYIWATVNDLEEIIKCTDDAEKEFTKYYKNNKMYDENNNQRVLIAKDGKEVVGTLIVSIETEGVGLGSVGCTTVKHSHRGRHIAVNMVILGSKYLKDIGLDKAYLGYTYTGLDRMYGYAGYKICIYYFMAKKDL